MSRIVTAVLLCALLYVPVVSAQEAPRADLYLDPYVITSLGETDTGCQIKIRFTVRNKGAAIEKARVLLDVAVKNVPYHVEAIVALPTGIVLTHDQAITVAPGTFNVQAIVNGHVPHPTVPDSWAFLLETSLANNSRSGPGACATTAR